MDGQTGRVRNMPRSPLSALLFTGRATENYTNEERMWDVAGYHVIKSRKAYSNTKVSFRVKKVFYCQDCSTSLSTLLLHLPWHDDRRFEAASPRDSCENMTVNSKAGGCFEKSMRRRHGEKEESHSGNQMPPPTATTYLGT